jgi:hypothetical protein
MKPTPSSPERKITLNHATGYEVEIDLLDARDGLTHLARALMGEIMFPKLRKSLKATRKSKSKIGWTLGIEAAAAEINRVVQKCNAPDLRALLTAVLWAHLMQEFDRLRQRENAAN